MSVFFLSPHYRYIEIFPCNPEDITTIPRPRRGGGRPGPYDRAGGRGGGMGGYGPPRGMGRVKGYGGEASFWFPNKEELTYFVV